MRMPLMASSSEEEAMRASRSDATQCGRNASPPLYRSVKYQSDTEARPPIVKSLRGGGHSLAGHELSRRCQEVGQCIFLESLRMGTVGPPGLVVLVTAGSLPFDAAPR